MATHSSILAWRIPRTGEPGRLLSLGSQRVRMTKRLSLHIAGARVMMGTRRPRMQIQ